MFSMTKRQMGYDLCSVAALSALCLVAFAALAVGAPPASEKKTGEGKIALEKGNTPEVTTNEFNSMSMEDLRKLVPELMEQIRTDARVLDENKRNLYATREKVRQNGEKVRALIAEMTALKKKIELEINNDAEVQALQKTTTETEANLRFLGKKRQRLSKEIAEREAKTNASGTNTTVKAVGK